MSVKSFVKKNQTGLKFMFFGILTTLVDYGFYILFSKIFGQTKMLNDSVYLLVNALSSFLAIVFAYITNKLFVFYSKSWYWKVLLVEIGGFFSTRLFALLVSELGILFLVEVCAFNTITEENPLFMIFTFAVTGDVIAKFILSFVSTAINYLFGKFLVFKKKKNSSVEKPEEEFSQENPPEKE